jgi:hypothetical protein
VQFSKDTNRTLLALALKQMGFVVTQQANLDLTFTKGYGQSGTLSVSGTMTLVNVNDEEARAIKRAYSVEVVKSAASRFGWNVKQPTATTFQIVRRS